MIRTIVAALACLLVSGCAAEVAQTGSVSPSTSASARPISSPSDRPEETAIQTPEPTQTAEALQAGTVLRVMVDGLRMRADPDTDGELVDTLNAGEEVGAVGGEPVSADGLTWYEVRQGPSERRGWVASGENHDWLAVVSNGRIALGCTTCVSGGAGEVTVFPDGSNQHVILDHPTVAAWSPSGGRIALWAQQGPEASLIIMAPDGTVRVDISGVAQAAWSPDGTQLVSTSAETRGLVLVDERGGTTPLTETGSQATWSPDGTRIVFHDIDCPGCAAPLIDPPIGIFTVTPLDAERELLVGSGAFSPEWSPDGETVAFGRLDYDGAFPSSFLQVPAAGGQPTPMRGVAEEAALYGFDWSPDGTGVVFGGPDGIVVANADGGDAVLVASHNDVLQAQNPRWSPDGRLVLYEMSAVNVGIFVHVVGSDGTGAYLVSEASGGGALGADWEPILARLP